MHISQVVEFLCDWDAVTKFSRKDNGEAFVEITALVGGYEYRSTGTTLESATPEMVKSIERATKMKYTRRLGGGRRRA